MLLQIFWFFETGLSHSLGGIAGSGTAAGSRQEVEKNRCLNSPVSELCSDYMHQLLKCALNM